jgi:hypothetical protein
VGCAEGVCACVGVHCKDRWAFFWLYRCGESLGISKKRRPERRPRAQHKATRGLKGETHQTDTKRKCRPVLNYQMEVPWYRPDPYHRLLIPLFRSRGKHINQHRD